MSDKVKYRLTVEVNEKSIGVTSGGTLSKTHLILVFMHVLRALKIKEVMPQSIACSLVDAEYDERLKKLIREALGMENNKEIIFDLDKIIEAEKDAEK